MGNRLSKAQYEATTWSARNWLSFTVQKLSVALHLAAAAYAIGQARGRAHAVDKREGARGGCAGVAAAPDDSAPDRVLILRAVRDLQPLTPTTTIAMTS